MRDLPTGTVTFLFTDVEGSTKLLGEIGDEAYEQALAEHRQVVREACSNEGGVEVDTQGDAFFFAFPTAPGALAAASRITSAFAPGPIQVRIGLHTGEARLGEEGYVGKEVHFAARIASSGHGGQVVLSAATAGLVDADLTDLGEHRLKDIGGPVSIYQLGQERFPPLKTISNTNLPRPASSFVGRERELEEVLRKIEQGARLLTLTGPGGSGKTRLALEAATTLVPFYKAGVFWVGLASLRDPSLVTEQISQTLGAKDGLAEHIAEREMLLLLDNLEQVVDAAPELSQLLSGCPNLTLLCTSRELLRISGEVEHPVPPLAEPEAVTLFCERSQLQPSEEIAELCERLDNLPLPVELAAARTRALTPGQILERLSQRLDLLKGGRDADPRQQTLRATIAWSYDLLSEGEQRLFRALSVFAGGCTLEAAEEVAEADLDTLQSLVEKSLLRFSAGRYWMLETIREFAGERLQEHADGDRARGAHLRSFVSLAAEAAPYLERGDEQERWLVRIEQERDNVRVALQHALDRGDARAFNGIAVGVWRYWWLRGYANEGRRWLDIAIGTNPDMQALRVKCYEAAAFLNYITGAYDQARVIIENWLREARQTGDTLSEGMAVHALGYLATAAGDYESAIAYEEQSLALCGDDPYARYPASGLGYLALLEGDLDRAESSLHRALEFERAFEDHEGVANMLALLSLTALARGDEHRSATLLRESAELSARLGYSWQFATRSLQGIAALLARHGRPADAVRLLGVADGIVSEREQPLGPLAESLKEETLRAARSALDDRELTEAREEGQRMYGMHDLDELVAFAIASLD